MNMLMCLGAAALGLTAAGCKELETTGSGGDATTSGSAGSGGATTSSEEGGGGSGGDTGGTGGNTGGTGGNTGGTGGTGGVEIIGSGLGDFVSAGGVCDSQGYSQVFTFGQATPHQGKATSAKYRLQGGIIGATGSLQ